MSFEQILDWSNCLSGVSASMLLQSSQFTKALESFRNIFAKPDDKMADTVAQWNRD